MSRKFNLCISILLFAAKSFSQSGLETVFTDDQYGIRQFNSVKISNDADKKIFVQFNVGNVYDGGEYKKLNKSTNTLSVAYGGFLDWRFEGECDFKTTAFPIESFVTSPLSEQRLIFNTRFSCDTAFSDTTIKSLDAGSSQSSIPVRNCAGFDISINDSIYYAAGSAELISFQIFKSTNRGVNWFVTDTVPYLKRLRKGGFIECHPSDPNILYVAGINNLLVSTNAGYNFINTNAPSFKKIYFNNSKLYGITSNKLFTSTDNGLSWLNIFTSLSFDFTCLEFTIEDSQIIFAGTHIGLFKSTDGGLSWMLYNNSFPESKNILGLSKDPVPNSPLYACTSKGIYKVMYKYYVPPNFINPLKVGSFFQYYVDDFSNQHYYDMTVVKDTIFSNGMKYYKLKFGENSFTFEFVDTLSFKWYKYEPGCQDTNTLIIDFLADTGSVYRQCTGFKKIVNKGLTNNILGDPRYLNFSTNYNYPPAFDVNADTYAEKFGFIKSFGYSYIITLTGAIINGITYGNINTLVSTISNKIPDKFSLEQNYPNPFNPDTKINYSIPAAQQTILKVYDALGNEIATLVNEKQNPGSYSYQFSTENYQLSSGIYFYKLTAGEFSKTKRMILIK